MLSCFIYVFHLLHVVTLCTYVRILIVSYTLCVYLVCICTNPKYKDVDRCCFVSTTCVVVTDDLHEQRVKYAEFYNERDELDKTKFGNFIGQIGKHRDKLFFFVLQLLLLLLLTALAVLDRLLANLSLPI